MTAEQRKNAVGTLHSENKKVSAALFADASNAADCAAVLDSRFADFLISFPADKSSAGEKYVSSLEQVNDSARGSGLSFAAAVRADLFASDGTDEAMMITEQLDACDSLDSCVGTVMYDYELFRRIIHSLRQFSNISRSAAAKSLKRTLNSEILRAAQRPQTNRK